MDRAKLVLNRLDGRFNVIWIGHITCKTFRIRNTSFGSL
jgi:hypothetical protein